MFVVRAVVGLGRFLPPSSVHMSSVSPASCTSSSPLSSPVFSFPPICDLRFQPLLLFRFWGGFSGFDSHTLKEAAPQTALNAGE